MYKAEEDACFFFDSIDMNACVIPAGYQFAACFDSICFFFFDSIDMNAGVIPAGYQFAACFDSIDINAAGEP
jgi:hypothetical protein